MKLIDLSITKPELLKLAKNSFGNLVKAVVDVDRKIMVIDGVLHADEEAYLLTHGSHQSDLWGINLYPELNGDDFIEFDSMINLRPSRGNSSRSVDDVQIQAQIRHVVASLVK